MEGGGITTGAQWSVLETLEEETLFSISRESHAKLKMDYFPSFKTDFVRLKLNKCTLKKKIFQSTSMNFISFT